MFVEQFLIDLPKAVQVDIDRVQIQQWDAKFVRSGNSDSTRIRHFIGDQIRHQRRACFSRSLGCLEHLSFADNAILHEAAWQAG